MVTNRQIGVRFLFFILTKFGDSGWGWYIFQNYFFIKKSCYFHPTFFSEHVYPLCVVYSSLNSEVFFYVMAISFKKNAEGEEIFTPYHFFKYLTTPTIFETPTTFYHPTTFDYPLPFSPYFDTLPLSWTPYHFRWPPNIFPNVDPLTLSITPAPTTFHDPLLISITP